MTSKKTNKQALPNKSRLSLVFEELEPRLLLSADLPIDVPAAYASEPDENESIAVFEGLAVSVVNTEIQAPHELVFVDTDTPDYQLLVDDILSHSNEQRLIEVILLDNNSDGIAQITSALWEYSELDAVHIISHGSEGSIDLGSTRLEFDTLLANSTAIQGWAGAFSESGDLLIYGCNLAASADGQSLVDSLARLTGADVAASDDLTGSEELGGDWELEYEYGDIETELAVSSQLQSQWNSILATPEITSNGGGTTASINVAENTTAVTNVTATDADLDTLTYSISGGTDVALFNIDSSTGALTFNSMLDFESPADADLNNDYQVTVTASDGNGGTDSQDITVTVTQTVDSGSAVWSNTSTTPQTNTWDGNNFGSSSGTVALNDNYRLIQGADAPTRDEKIVVGVDATGNVTGEMWNGSSWSALPLNNLGTVSESYWYGVDVAYEQLSGDAIIVWNDNSQPAGDKLRYAVWDGSSWSTPQSIAAYTGAEPQNLKLAFDSGSDAMVLVVDDVNADDYALVWDGSSWGNAVTLDTSGTLESDQSAIAVSFEAQSGNAMVTYGIEGSTDVYYRIWNGTSWGAEASVAAAAGISGDAKWLVTATDYSSNRIALATMTTAGEVWLSVWDGSSWEPATLAETSTTGTTYPNLAVAFESTTGQALATYGESGQSDFRYQTWDSVSGWSGEQIGPAIGAIPNSMTLDSGPTSDHIMLSIQDANSDLHYLRWDGSAWSVGNELSTNTGETKNQPFAFIYDQDGLLVDPNDAPVNTVPSTQNTAIDTSVVFSAGNGNAISVADTDDTSVEITLTATNGTLTLSGLTGLSFSVGDGSADSNMTFTGTLADINAAFDGLQFDPTAAFEGFASVQLSTTDFAGGGAGGIKSDVDTVNIEVGDVNTAPVNAVPSAQTIDQDGMLLFSSTTGTAISISDADAAGAAIEVTLTATNGTLNLSGNKGLTFSIGDGTTDASMTFTGTIADINTALEGMTFTATAGYTGAASVQITTNDLGNTGAGGALTDTDTVTITVAVPDHTVWMTFENDEANTGNSELPDFTAGDVVNYGGTLTFESGTTSGTFSKNFNLDLIAGTDGNTSVDAVHYVTRAISVGGIDLQVGDLLLSTAATEVIDGLTYNKEDVFVFRPTTAGTYSAGSFFMLIEGKNSGVVGNVTGISLVEQTTVVGDVTLNTGDFVIADGSKNIVRFEAGQLGATTSGTTSILIQGADINIGQNIGALHLVQEDTAIGDSSLQAGQLLVGLVSNDSTVGDTPTINVLRQDLFLLDVTATGAGTSAATATRFFEGLDENLDNNNETIWGVTVQQQCCPTANDETFSVDENSANGTVVGSVSATDPENATLRYAITGGNTSSAFTIDAATGQITVANSAALDFETTPSFTLIVAAIDDKGAYDTATVTIDLNNLDEAGTNDAPENSIPADQTIGKDGMLLFSSATGTAISISDFDAGTNPVQVTLTAINGTLNLSGTQGLTFSTGDGMADATMTFTGTIADINAALEGMTFVATASFTGTASLQIITDDLGNTGSGGALSDTDSVSIDIQSADQRLWMTFSDDETTGNADIPTMTGGDVVLLKDITQLEASNTDPTAAVTAGTFTYQFNLDTVLLSDGVTTASADGNTKVNATHYVSRDIQVGTNSLQLFAGDLILSTDGNEVIDGVTYNSEDLFVFRPDTFGDYSQGSFFMLVDGSDIGLGKVTGVSLVESTTTVGDVTLNAGEFLIGHDGSGNNIDRYVPGTLGDISTGVLSILVKGGDINVGQKIGGIHLVQANTILGGVSLTAGQLLVSLQGEDSTVGDGTTIDVLRHDIFVLDVSATGDGTSAATASRFFEGLDENLDSNREAVSGISLMGNAAPSISAETFNVDENSANGTVAGAVTASDPENATLSYAITAGNTGGAFTINATTGQITVANSVVLDFETTPSFSLTVATIDDSGAYGSATITVNLYDVNEAPILDNTGTMVLTTITEDETANPGNTVAEIIASAGGDRITDPDAGSVEGIAVTGLNSSNGTWQYSINGGSTWSNVGTVSDTSAMLLRATDKLRFVPDAQNADSASVTFRAWDQIGGSAGSKVDASSNGGTTAFSTATETASITVTAVNDAPSGISASLFSAIEEDNFSSAGKLVSDFTSITSDPDVGALKGIAVTAVDNTNGEWQYTLNGTNWFAIGDVSTTSARLLPSDATARIRFVPDPDFNDTSVFPFTIAAWDQTSGTAGGLADVSVNGGSTAFSAPTTSVSIRVDAVNDAPTATAGSVSLSAVAEDTADPAGETVAVLFGPVFSDARDEVTGGSSANSLAGVVIVGNAADTGAEGNWQWFDGSGWQNISTSVSTSSGLVLSSSTLVRFLPNADYNGAPGGLTVRLVDDSAGALTSGTTVDVTVSGGTTRYSDASNAVSLGTSVTPVNDSPTVAANTGTTVDEGSTANVITTAMLNEGDPDDSGAGLIYTLTGDVSNGTLKLNGTALNVSDTFSQADIDAGLVTYDHDGSETTTDSFAFSLADGGEDGATPATGTFNITVTAVNDAPTVSLTNLVNNLTEDTDTSSAIRIADIVITDADLGTNNLTLAGADAADFEIVGTELRLKAGTSLDFETKASFDVTVQVDDAAIPGSPDDTALHTLNITDVNEAPTVSLTNTTTTFPEDTDTSTRIKVADIVIADDALGTNTLSLSGADAALFEIDTGVLYLKAGTVLDFETKVSLDVTVAVDDAAIVGSPEDTAALAITVTDVNEFAVGPVSDSDAAADTVAEDAIVGTTVGITGLATDADGTDTVTYSLSDDAGGRFAIDTNTGIVTVNAALDAETATSHSITVVATSSDTSTSSQGYTITVTDVDEFDVGAVTDADGTANTVAENALVGDAVGITATASDADVDDNITYSLSDNAGGLFTIDSATGVITVASALDYETATSHNITVLATSDDLSTSSQVFSISVTDVNEFAVGPVTDNDGTVNTVAENALVGGAVGITGLATDADGTDTVTYSLSDDAGGLFSIDTNTGVITVANALDYETATSHSVTVLATSSDTSTSSQAFSISVTDVNEFAIGPVTDNDAAADTVAEDAIVGTSVGITGLATDADGTDTVTYSLSDDGGGLFSIDTNTGVITVANALDYETATSHSVTVLATSSDTSTSSQAFTINVTDINESAVGAVTDSDAAANTVAEDAIVGTSVGITGLAADADGTDTVTYSLSDDAGGLFTIDSNTGDITVANALDYETATSHSVTVLASSSDSSTSSQAFTISVTDVNEFAVGPVTDNDAAADTVAEDATVGTTVGITGLATDADGTDTVTYSLSDDAGGLFSIDTNTGVITVANALDYETATSHSVTVLATSSDASTSSQAFTINITDVNEFAVGSVADSDAAVDTVAEDAIVGTTVGITGLATDADGTDTVTYSLSDDAGGLFSIDTNTGVITVANALDYETATSHSVTVLATSSDTSTSSQAFTISVTDVNEFAVGPVTDSDAAADTVAEDATVGTTVGITALATDADGTDTVTYSLSDNAGGLFTIDTNTGVITVANALDYETATSHSVTVLATSSDTSTSSQAFTINVTDVNEFAVGPVTDNDAAADTVAEDAIVGTTVGITGLATDADGTDTVTYSLSDDAGGLFSIDTNTGVITVANALDYETATSHSVTVLATSSDTSTSSQAFTISVTDVNEFAVGPVTDSDAAVDTVAEDATVGTSVGVTGLATDADGTDTVTYSLSDDAGGLFSIDTNTGVITVANALDYETATSHSVTVLATSSDASTSSQAFTINITDVNEFAVGSVADSDAALNTVAEDAIVGTTVGITGLATDADGTDTVTYSLSDNAGGLFTIDTNTGVITVANALDYETATSHSVTVLATSSDTSTSSQAFTISVTDVNEFAVGPVTDSDAAVDTVAEDATVGTSVGVTGLATDADGTDTVTYSLSDDAGGLFSIDTNTGMITVANALDYETATSHSVTVLATSSDTSTSSQAFTINVTDVNEFAVGPVTDNDAAADTVAEDAIVGTSVGVTGLATDADGTDTVTYSLSDDAGGLFTIDANTGVITVANAIDYETATSHSVTVLATSSDTSTSSQAFTISVTDVNEFAVGPVTDSDAAADTVAEDATVGTTVGITALATDADGTDTATYSLSDDAGGLFSIDTNTGVITVANALDYETATSHSVTVLATSSDTSTSSQAFTINVTDVNEFAIGPVTDNDGTADTVAEDAIVGTTVGITSLATDADGADTVTYSLSDDAGGLFTIDSNTGVITVANVLDYETATSHSVTVLATSSDTSTSSQAFTINVTDINESAVGVVSDSNAAANTVAENALVGDTVGITTLATDADGTDTVTYSLSDAAGGLFTIDVNTGVITVANALDYETATSHSVTVLATSSDTSTSSQAFTINVTDINESAVGVVSDSNAAANTVAENALVGDTVGITTLATDADGTDTVTYSLSDAAGGLFTIDVNTGVITVANALDYETATSHSVTVLATSSDTSTSSQAFTISVTDVNEFAVGPVTDSDAAVDTVAEDATVGTSVGVTGLATDADGTDTVTYSLSDDAGGLFSIDTNTGVITVANALDYETATSHSVTVLATSSDASTSSQAFTINITDVNEFAVGSVADSDAALNTVAEDAIVGTTVGITGLATDADGTDTVTYSLSDNAGGLFTIDTNTGVITVANALDYETATSHSVTVLATSSDTSTSSQAFTISVTDVNEFAVGPVTDSDAAVDTVAEDATVGTSVGVTGLATDADGTDTVTYSLSDDAGGLFSIDTNTGMITVANALDYETATSHSVTVLATSSDTSTSSQAFTINVTDVNEFAVGPVTDNDAAADTVAEDAIVGTTVGITGLATDADGTDTVTYSLSDDAGGLFTIDANTGVITVANAIDYETATSHSVTVLATSSDTSTSSQAFTISVTDVNEFAVGPVTDSDAAADTVAEDATVGTTVGITALATDADGTDTATYSLSDDAGGLFSIDTNTGVITVANALDYETATSHSVTVLATSSDTSTSSQAFTINVTDVNEFAIGPVTDNDGTADTVAEDAIVGTTVGITSLATDADGADTVTYSLSDDAGGLFTIDSNTGVITVANVLDYETATSHSVTVLATSSDTSTSSQAFTINVTDINESAVGVVSDSNAAANTVAENALVGDTVGITTLATDADGTDTVTYSLSDAAGGLFTIDVNTGVITVADALDYETATSHSVTVLATSSDTSTSSQAFTISVTDVNEFAVGPVTDSDAAADTVAEDATVGTTVGITGLATDADGTDTVTYSLSDDAGGLFTIDTNTGVITVANALDYETATSHSVTVLATSSDTSTSSQAFTISVTDVNEFAVGPVTDSDAAVDTVAEDATVGTSVGVTGLATDADGTDTVTYSLSDDAGGLFSIDTNTGMITVANALDYETATSHSVTVLATSSDTSTSSQAFTISVTDVNEFAVGPVTDSDAAVDTVAEDATVGTSVGVTGLATDADGTDTVTYSLSDDAGGLFTIDTNTGVITVANALDYETATNHSVTVLATSSDTSTSSQAFTISVTDVNEFAVGPVTDSDAAVDTVAEDATVGTSVGVTGLATDADGTDTVTYSLSDDAGGLFTIDTNTGVITVANALDYETATSHSVTVLASSSDSSTSSQAFTISVTDVNEFAVGPVTDNDAAADTVAEDATVGTTVGITGLATDADGTDTVTYSLSDDAGGLFSIDTNTGVITVANALDYETATSHSVTVLATSSDASTSSQAFTINITDVNEFAVGSVADSDAALNTVAEDAIVGTTVGITGLATDADGTDTVTYSLSDNAGGLFAIDANTGVITVANALDYETATSHSVTVLATSSDASTSSQAFTISVTDVNEFAIGAVTDNDGTANTVAEDVIVGTTVGITALATDADGSDTVTYSLSDDAGGLFAIDVNTGVITVANALDYETAISHNIIVVATSSDTSTSSQVFNITVTDVNDAPVGLPTITGTATEGQILTADTTGISDADGLGVFGYQWLRDGVAIAGATSGAYILGDVDVGTQISVQVSYTDGHGTVEGPLTSAPTAPVTNVNDAPIAVNDAYTTNEDAALTATLGVDDLLLNDSDLDGDNLTVNTAPVVNVSNGTLVLNADGTFTYTPNADFNGVETFTYEISDGNGGTAFASVNINIGAINDAPVNTMPAAQTTIENTPLMFSNLGGNGLSVSDPDASGAVMEVTLTASNGTLDLSGTSGLVFMVGDGNTDTTMTFAGNVADINAALDGLMFNPDAGYQGFATLQIIADDLGNSGAGGALNAVDTVNISVVENTIASLISTLPPLDELIDDLTGDADTIDGPKVSSTLVRDDVADDVPNEAGSILSNTEQLDVYLSGGGGRGLPDAQALSSVRSLDLSDPGRQSDGHERASAFRLAGYVARWTLADPLVGVKALLQVQPGSPLWSLINDMTAQIDDNHAAWLSDDNVFTASVSGLTISVTAGYVSWLLRAGYLSASLLSSLPLWREFDPLPILATSKDKKHKGQVDNKESGDSTDIETEEIFAQSAHTEGIDSGQAAS